MVEKDVKNGVRDQGRVVTKWCQDSGVVLNSLQLRCPWMLRGGTNIQTCASIVDRGRGSFLQFCADVFVASISLSSRFSHHCCVVPEARLATKCNKVMPKQWCCTDCWHWGYIINIQKTTTKFTKSFKPSERFFFLESPIVTDPGESSLTPPYIMSCDSSVNHRQARCHGGLPQHR